MKGKFLLPLAGLISTPLLAADAISGEVQRQPLNISAIVMFVIFVAATLFITYWASKRNRSASDYYAAGGRITGFQNGLAIAGDYMSAASFLGISALVYTSGYDGLIYSIGFLVGWPIILFLIAERLRNLGKYTFADVASYRLKQTSVRSLSASGSLVVVALYLIAQMVGAGKLIELLGILMVLYVLFGGMLATTWVQIIKAVMLLSGASFMAIMVMKSVNFDVGTLFSEAVKVHANGAAIMSPGGLVADPISAISLGLALMFGTAGLPHILMRFFTVSDAKEARKSVFYATGFIGYFYILTFIIGFGAILAVSHDLYACVIKEGKANEADELRVSKMTTLVLGVVAIGLGILFEKQNIAFMVGLAFSIAASCNFPVLFLSMFWSRLTTRGAVYGGWLGLISAVTLMILGPTVWVKVLGHAQAIFPYEYPALFSMGLAFIGIWFFSVTDKSQAASDEHAKFFPQFVRSQTGLGASGASAH